MKEKTLSFYRHVGFTLVELLVGLVIGLIATLVIMQTFSAFEGNKRSTTGISDAQTNGSIGLFMIQRELQFAGYGLPVVSGTLPIINVNNSLYNRNFQNYAGQTRADIEAAQNALATQYAADIENEKNTVIIAGENYSAMRCNPAPQLSIDQDGDPSTPDAMNVDIITPVNIVNGVNNDTISIQYFDSSRGGLPTLIKSTPPMDGSGIYQPGPDGLYEFGVENNIGCRAGDYVLVLKDANTGDTSCIASQIPPVFKTDVSTATAINSFLDANPNKIKVKTSLNYDPADPTKDAQTNNRIACIGRRHGVEFSVTNNRLMRNGQELVSDIVSLQAQYGVSPTSNSEIINEWQDASGAWAAPNIDNRNRIKAVRLAVIARNGLFERDVVSQDCNGAASGPARVCLWDGNTNANLSASLGADWDHYRYRVYELIVPLKNVLTASPQL